MRFKRSTVRYSTTPAPVTPYQAAQQLWDERIGSARVQAKNWRLMAFGMLGLAGTALSALIWEAGRSTTTPFVIEVDRQGEARAVGPAAANYQPTEAQIQYYLERFIRNIRSLPLDPIVLRQQWLEAYDFTTDRGAVALNEYARANDPFARVGHSTVAVEVSSVVRASPNSFQVRWTERSYTDGTPSTTERWTTIVTVFLKPPHDEVKLRKNPLGIYVDSLDWSRELGAG